ncbi:hypothetical protein PVAND_005389 [Polypedilum vanderplanki]|uniref:Uncharacterized protein n=1 Tax=Polypedilum vanderplanki TaxID=319348 RepID=A0A9J6BZT9_POLVA|nr:hypothetical protein PVAND_005389 [Polypedilum vanderplanki]
MDFADNFKNLIETEINKARNIIDELDKIKSTDDLLKSVYQFSEEFNTHFVKYSTLLRTLEDVDKDQTIFTLKQKESGNAAFNEGFMFIEGKKKICQQYEITKAAVTKNAVNTITLSPIKIKPFKGNTLEWISFKHSFNSIIGNNDNITDDTKLLHLKANVDGEVIGIIQHYQASDFQQAFAALEDKYGGTKQIISSEISRILNLKVLQKNKEDIENFLINIKTFNYNLKKIDIDVNTWNPLFNEVLIRKMSVEMKEEFHEFCEYSSIQDATIENWQTFLQKKFDRLPTHSKSQDKKKEKKSCSICAKKHYANRCDLLKAAQSKLDFLKQRKLCIKCAAHPDHEKCNNEKKLSCRECKGAHLSILHSIN